MGESAQEEAAREQSARIGGIIGGYTSPTGASGYLTRMSQIDPYVSKALGNIDRAVENMRAYGSANLGSLRGTTGASMVEAGGAPGSPIQSSFLAQIAPAIGGIAQETARFEGQKANINMTAGDILKTLMLSGDQTISDLFRTQGGAIGMMKDTTTLGDIGGVLQTGLGIASGLFAPSGLVSALGLGGNVASQFGFGGKGGGGGYFSSQVGNNPWFSMSAEELLKRK